MSITASQVKELRERTGAGMLDCKKALQEASGDFDQAADWLRAKGLSKAAKKAGRVAAEGIVQTYMHGGRVGVIVEVNSETDFVARNEDFQAFTKDIAMHIAASAPLAVREEEISTDLIEKERAVLIAKAKEEGKKEEMISKIVDGQIKKWITQQCLLEQKFVKNPDVTVGEHLTNMVAKIGEKLDVRRFVRFELGEGIAKKEENFADEVAAVTQQH